MIPNGVDVPDEERTRRLAAPILFLGRIDVRQKGLDLLLAAVADEPDAPARHRRLRHGGRDQAPARAGAAVGSGPRPTARPGRRRTQGGPAARVPLRRRPVPLRDVLPHRARGPRLRQAGRPLRPRPAVLDRPDAGVAVPAFDVAALRTAMRAAVRRRAAPRRARRGRPRPCPRPRPGRPYPALPGPRRRAAGHAPSRPQRRNRLRSADRRSRASSGSRDTTSDRAHAAAATDPATPGRCARGRAACAPARACRWRGRPCTTRCPPTDRAHAAPDPRRRNRSNVG